MKFKKHYTSPDLYERRFELFEDCEFFGVHKSFNLKGFSLKYKNKDLSLEGIVSNITQNQDIGIVMNDKGETRPYDYLSVRFVSGALRGAWLDYEIAPMATQLFMGKYNLKEY